MSDCVRRRRVCAPPGEEMQREIVVTAPRPSDEALAAESDGRPAAGSLHLQRSVTVTAENGVVRVAGVVRDLSDLLAILRSPAGSRARGGW